MRRLLKGIVVSIVLLLVAAGALWFFLFRAPPPGTPAQTIAIASGKLRGLDERGVTVYRGIPYAAPPVGDLRWRAPAPVAAWQGTRDAFKFSKACPQIGSPVPGMPPEPTAEDCLYLNVWTPSAKHDALPVIVWVHGGSNLNGSASAPPYGGANLARKGAVVVSLNYRLGALGFLALPELSAESGHGASGNYGMMDILAALRWVQANAVAFGGDPANVTVMGQSAGAWNMSHLQVSPLARGLYKRLIAMSGGNFGPSDTPQGVATLHDAEQAGLRFEQALGAKSLAEMRTLAADRIVGASPDIWRATISGSNTAGIVDGYVVPAAPHDAYAQANPADLLTGYTSEEGINWAPRPIKAADFRKELESYQPLTAEFLKLYPAGTDAQATRSNQRLQGERAFKWQAATWARLHRDDGKGRVWFYRFSHTTGIGPFRNLGPGHGSELGHVFDFPRRGLRYGTQWPWNAAKDVALIDTIQSYWINFARTGDPNGPGLPKWPGFGPAMQAIEFGGEARAIAWPDAAEHRLMDRYMESLRKAPRPSSPTRRP